MFSAFFDHARQLENASNRHRLSAICQSNRKAKETRIPRETDKISAATRPVLPVPNTGSDPRGVPQKGGVPDWLVLPPRP
jgi:hypothetical protein